MTVFGTVENTRPCGATLFCERGQGSNFAAPCPLSQKRVPPAGGGCFSCTLALCFCNTISSYMCLSLKPRRAVTLLRGKVTKTRSLGHITWCLTIAHVNSCIYNPPAAAAEPRQRVRRWKKEYGVRAFYQRLFPLLDVRVLCPDLC